MLRILQAEGIACMQAWRQVKMAEFQKDWERIDVESDVKMVLDMARDANMNEGWEVFEGIWTWF